MSASAKNNNSNGALSRRSFLTVAAAAGGGLLLGFEIPAFGQGAPAATPYILNPNAFIAIAPDGKVSFQIPQEEMGQGVYTSLSQLLADELDVSFDQVTALPAPPIDALYGSPKSHRMGTGGSQSIRSFYVPLRQVGASGRAMLVSAAAAQWKVDPATLRTENGQVIDDAHGGRKLGYGELAPHAAKLQAPQNPKLKDDKDLKLIGHPVHRLDAAEKGNGTAQYGIDVRLPGLKVATLAASPVVGGKVGHVDDSKLPSGLQLVVLDDIVAVVGPNFWSAKKGLDALKITWNGGANAKLNSDQIWKELRATSARKGVEAVAMGDADKGLTQGNRMDAAYELPFLSHSPMEPLNFTVHVTPGGVEMWGGSQVQSAAVAAAAKTLGITPDKVNFHNYMLGGGFGRRLDVDMVVKAARIAQKVDGPVKVIWTREEDMTQDMYRPGYRNVMAASLTSDGKLTGWTHRIAGASVGVRMSGQPLKGGLDRGSVDGALDNIYGVPNFRVEYIQAEPRALNVGYWRGVAPNNSIFAIESFIDELALKAGKDPLTFRLDNLGGQPRLKAALQLAAQKANWGSKLGPRRGRGICAQFAFGTFIATIADAEVDENGEVKIHRYTSAVDAGHVVNPDGLTAQLQGGLIFSSTAALYGKITVKDGRVEQTNFNNYRMVRMSEAPAIDVHIIASKEAPGGMGEPGCSAGQPALVNAIAAATGVRLRSMPIDRDLLSGRKSV
jgi:isoquinoline 1-oxidoreductase beta subunit